MIARIIHTLIFPERNRRTEHIKNLDISISDDKRSRSVGEGLQEPSENQIETQSLLQRQQSASSTNLFLPNVAHVKHNVSEKMAQVKPLSDIFLTFVFTPFYNRIEPLAHLIPAILHGPANVLQILPKKISRVLNPWILY